MASTTASSGVPPNVSPRSRFRYRRRPSPSLAALRLEFGTGFVDHPLDILLSVLASSVGTVGAERLAEQLAHRAAFRLGESLGLCGQLDGKADRDGFGIATSPCRIVNLTSSAEDLSFAHRPVR